MKIKILCLGTELVFNQRQVVDDIIQSAVSNLKQETIDVKFSNYKNELELLHIIKIVNPQLIVLSGIDLSTDSTIPIVKIVDPDLLLQKADDIGKEQIVPLFRQQVSIIVNALRRL